jgi:hypothetical protein
MQKNESLLIGNRYTELNPPLVEDNRFSLKSVLSHIEFRTGAKDAIQQLKIGLNHRLCPPLASAPHRIAIGRSS